MDAGADDRAAIQTLYEEVIVRAAWHRAPPEGEPTFAELSESETILVATDGAGTLQGVVSVFERDSFIHHLFVASRFQRSGVGTALLDFLAPTLPTPWRLKCVEANAAALAFYGVRGWREVDRGRGDDGAFIVLERD